MFRLEVSHLQALTTSGNENYSSIYLDLIIRRSFLLRMRKVADIICRENQTTHFVYNNFFLNRAKSVSQPHVRPSVRMQQLGSHCKAFREIWYLKKFPIRVDKITVPYNLPRITGTSHCTTVHLGIKTKASRWVIFRIVNVSAIFAEKIKTHILCSMTFLFPRKSCGLWENVGKNVVEPASRPHMTIQYGPMRFACWVTKPNVTHTHTHSEYRVSGLELYKNTCLCFST